MRLHCSFSHILTVVGCVKSLIRKCFQTKGFFPLLLLPVTSTVTRLFPLLLLMMKILLCRTDGREEKEREVYTLKNAGLF